MRYLWQKKHSPAVPLPAARSGRAFFLLTLALGMGVFLGINILAGYLPFSPLDATQEKLYTLSSATRDTLHTLPSPVKLRFFYNDAQATGVPAVQQHAVRVRTLLQQYARLSGGRVTLEMVRPEPFTEAEDEAAAAGLRGIPVDNVGSKLYCGLVVRNARDQQAVVPFFAPSQGAFLEYDPTRLLHGLTQDQKIAVGLISPLSVVQESLLEGKTAPWAIAPLIRNQYRLMPLPPAPQSIPDYVQMLLVIHPNLLTEEALAAIDRFMVAGGRAIFVVDPLTFSEGMPDDRFRSSDLNRLFRAWGFEQSTDTVAADRETAIRVQMLDADSRLRSIPNVTWMGLGAPQVNPDQVMTAHLSHLRMAVSSYFTPLPALKTHGLRWTPLLMTSEDARPLERSLVQGSPDPSLWLRDFVPTGKKLVLSALVEGVLPSAFPEKTDSKKTDSAKMPSGKAGAEKNKRPARMIVVGDVDMFRDGFWVAPAGMGGGGSEGGSIVPTADNGAFSLNALDYLSESEGLIALRSRTPVPRPFTKVESLRAAAEARFREEEMALKDKLQGLEQQLQQGGGAADAATDPTQAARAAGGGAIFSSAQQDRMAAFRAEIVQTRQSLRQVQRALQEDIDALARWVKWLVMGVMPCVVLALAFVLPRRWMRRG